MVENFQIEEMVEQTQRTVSYKAYNTQSGRKVLLKRYLVDDSSGVGRIENWQDEFQTLVNRFSQLDHPSLHSIIGGGLDPQDGSPYIVFEWVEMSTLSKIIAGQKLDDTHTIAMTKSTLKGLEFLNQSGIVHAGINPQMIGYTNAENKNPWFLLWCPVRAMSHKHGVGRSGLDAYSAPEVLSGEKANAVSDVYALGKTIEKSLGTSDSVLSSWLVNLTNPDPLERCKSSSDALLSLKQSIENASKKTTTRVFLKTPSRAGQTASTQDSQQADAQDVPSKRPKAKAAVQSGQAAKAKPGYKTSASPSQKKAAITKKSTRVPIAGATTPSTNASSGSGYLKIIVGLSLALIAVVIAIFVFKPRAKESVVFEDRAVKNTALSAAELRSKVLKPTDVALVKGVKGGLNVSIEGVVSFVGESKSGKTVMLNFRGSNKNNRPKYFSIWVPRSVHFKDESVDAVKSQFEKKKIRARGRLNYSSMLGGHYVQIASPKDLKILGN